MSINNGLKAYVRYDKTGRIVPGGPIYSHTKPKNGDWVEIDSLDCCNLEILLQENGDDLLQENSSKILL